MLPTVGKSIAADGRRVRIKIDGPWLRRSSRSSTQTESKNGLAIGWRFELNNLIDQGYKYWVGHLILWLQSKNSLAFPPPLASQGRWLLLCDKWMKETNESWWQLIVEKRELWNHWVRNVSGAMIETVDKFDQRYEPRNVSCVMRARIPFVFP